MVDWNYKVELSYSPNEDWNGLEELADRTLIGFLETEEDNCTTKRFSFYVVCDEDLQVVKEFFREKYREGKVSDFSWEATRTEYIDEDSSELCEEDGEGPKHE